jgi:hypothetical protein
MLANNDPRRPTVVDAAAAITLRQDKQNVLMFKICFFVLPVT